MRTPDGEELTVGQAVKVHDPYGTARRGQWVDGEIVKVGRKYVYIKPTGRAWGDGEPYLPGGSKVGSLVGSFATLTQWAEREQVTAAETVLRAQGIEISWSRSWTPRQKLALADAVARIRGLDTPSAVGNA